MDDIALARAIHVVSVVLWIGGVGFVTTVVIPTARRRGAADERLALFETIESRFSRFARWLVLIAGLSGLYLAHRLGLWPRFLALWWMAAMAGLWLLFAVILFILEPVLLRRWFADRAAARPDRTMRLVQAAHWILLTLAVATIIGAVAGSHRVEF